MRKYEIRELPNGGFIILEPSTYSGVSDTPVGAYSDAASMMDSLWQLVKPPESTGCPCPICIMERELANATAPTPDEKHITVRGTITDMQINRTVAKGMQNIKAPPVPPTDGAAPSDDPDFDALKRELNAATDELIKLSIVEMAKPPQPTDDEPELVKMLREVFGAENVQVIR